MSPFSLRDYQTTAVEFLLARDRGFVVAPAGAGKTAIAAEAIARRAKPGWKIGILVNTREHLESLFEAKERGVASIQEFLARREGEA